MEKPTRDWTNLPKESMLSKFAAEVKDILDTVGHNEMYGVELKAPEEG